MRKIIVSFLTIVVFVSCQDDEMKEGKISAKESDFSKFKESWIHSDLDISVSKTQRNTTCYLFSKEELSSLQKNSKLEKVRFVLGLTNGKLDIKTQGVDIKGENLGVINSTVYFEESLDSAVNKLANSSQEFPSNNETISKHLLNPTKAYDYINKWNTKLTKKSNLNATVSYDNLRINHFSIEKEVINEISHFTHFSYLGIFLGINPEGKLTTVLVGLDENKTIILPSKFSKTVDNSGGIYDFTKPCPSTCD